MRQRAVAAGRGGRGDGTAVASVTASAPAAKASPGSTRAGNGSAATRRASSVSGRSASGHEHDVAEPAPVQHVRRRDHRDLGEHRGGGRRLGRAKSSGVRRGAGARRRRRRGSRRSTPPGRSTRATPDEELHRGQVRGDPGAGEDVEQHDVARAGRHLGERRPGRRRRARRGPARRRAAARAPGRPARRRAPRRAAASPGGSPPRSGAGSTRRRRGAARAAARAAAGSSASSRCPSAAHVLELEVGRVVEVDVALRGAVDQQRPGRRAVRVADQLGAPVVDLGPDDRRGEPRSSCANPPWHPAPARARRPRTARQDA